jgi:hypothetical protein
MQQHHNDSDGGGAYESYHHYIMRKLREEREMKYDWPKIYKAEDNIEMQITDLVYDHVLGHFGVEELDELTEENILEVQAFWDDMNEYNCMGIGYSNLINTWESENGES